MAVEPINIHNRTAIMDLLARQLVMFPSMIAPAQAMAQKAYVRHRGDQSKYLPHQGEREKARRLKQMAKRQLQSESD